MVSSILVFILGLASLSFQVRNGNDSVLNIFQDVKDLKDWSVIEESKQYIIGEWADHYPSFEQVFPEYGLKNIIKLSFAGAGNQIITAEVFYMEDPAGAYGLFSITRGDGGILAGFGDESFIENICIHLWKGTYYIRITADQENEAAREGVSEIAQFIDKRIEVRGEKPAIVEMLPEEGFVTEKTRYFRGIAGLNFKLSSCHEYINGFSEGVQGDFGTHRLLLFEYENPEIREEWSERIFINLESNSRYTVLENECTGRCYSDKDGNQVVFGSAGKFIMVFIGRNITRQPELFEHIEDAILKHI